MSNTDSHRRPLPIDFSCLRAFCTPVGADVLSHLSGRAMKVLVVDVGGSHVKLLATGRAKPRRFPSGPTLTARQMVAAVKKLAGTWKYDAVALGYPGSVLRNRPVAEPHNLGRGWVGFDFESAFGCPTKVVNDAAMQALGGYKGGKMLYLGLGTGLGTTMIADGIVEPMELGHLPYKKATYEDYVGSRGLERLGKKKWRRHVARVIACLAAALDPDDVVIGGGNANKLARLPPGFRLGDNANAFLGGFRMWQQRVEAKHAGHVRSRRPPPRARRASDRSQAHI